MKNQSRLLIIALLVGFLAPGMTLAEEKVEQEYFEVEEVWDPLEGVNRGIFWFNNQFDKYLLEPVAIGYDWAMPEEAQRSIDNVFYNINVPSRLISDVIQLKFTQFLEHSGAFLINTTLGLGGLFDVAEDFGLEQHDEDVASALAYWGVPAGPYLVLPFLGPSNVRDAVGYVGDVYSHPVPWILEDTSSSKDYWYITAGALTIRFVNKRAILLDAVDAAREAALDEYLFMQSAYYQYRAGLVHDGNIRSGSEGDSFGDDFDDFEDE